MNTDNFSEMVFCSDCKKDIICYRKNCKGKYLNRDGSWKKPYLTSLDKGGVYVENKSFKIK